MMGPHIPDAALFGYTRSDVRIRYSPRRPYELRAFGICILQNLSAITLEQHTGLSGKFELEDVFKMLKSHVDELGQGVVLTMGDRQILCSARGWDDEQLEQLKMNMVQLLRLALPRGWRVNVPMERRVEDEWDFHEFHRAH